MKVLYLNADDVMKTDILRFSNVLEIVKDALIMYRKNLNLFSEKVSQIFNDMTQERINCLMSTLFDKGICGMKWVAVFPENPCRYGLPNSNSLVVLSEIEHGTPVAIIDFSIGTAIRTAAVNALAAQYLSAGDASVMGVIGSGVQARYNIQSILYTVPQIQKCYIVSRRKESENKLRDLLSDCYPAVEFITCNGDIKKSVEKADIIITATSA